MGTTLTGSQINNTYDGLIKTTDNTALSATTKLISDGLGNDSCIKVGTAGTDFLGNVDFSAATVTGLPDNNTTYDLGSAQAGANVSVSLTGSDATTDTVTLAAGTNITLTDNGSCQITIDSTGAAGLVSGTGTDSMKNADSLVTNPATASGGCSIALGDGASAAGNFTVAIGCGASASLVSGTAVGALACASSAGTALGNAACAAGGTSVSLGDSSDATADSSIAIGYTANATATCAVAIGRGVTAATAETVSVKALETQTASTPTAGGIIMTDAGSVARRLNITAAGALQIDSTPVGGGGGAAGLVSGTGTDSLKNADSLVTTPAVAACAGSIALGNGATANPAFGTVGSIAIGCGTSTLRGGVIVIGGGATASDANTTAIGYGAAVISNNGTAVGYNSCASREAVALGNDTNATQRGAVTIGYGASFILPAEYAISIGHYAGFAACACTVNIGREATAQGINSIAIGNRARVEGTGNDGAIIIGGSQNTTVGLGSYVALGCNALVTAQCGVAIGANVTAARACTATTCQYEACVAGKGIVVTSPDGLTTLGIGIDNTGAIVTYTP